MTKTDQKNNEKPDVILKRPHKKNTGSWEMCHTDVFTVRNQNTDDKGDVGGRGGSQRK
jgi:hypothetical protein